MPVSSRPCWSPAQRLIPGHSNIMVAWDHFLNLLVSLWNRTVSLTHDYMRWQAMIDAILRIC